MEGCNREAACAKADWHVLLLGTIFDAMVGFDAGASVEVVSEDGGHIVRCIVIQKKGKCDLMLYSVKDVMDMFM